jgi:hypothetical protein
MIITELAAQAKQINTDQEIEQVAALSAQDPEVGKLISEVIQEV